MKELVLAERDSSLYTKLHSSASDIGVAQQCAAHIMKKGWHDYSFKRRGNVRMQQIAFYTTMIVSYARPFAIGRNGTGFPKKLLRFRSKEIELHKQILDLRNKEYAHSDPSRTKVMPLHGAIKDIFSIRDVRFSRMQIEIFLEMTSGIQERIAARIEQIRLDALRRVRRRHP